MDRDPCSVCNCLLVQTWVWIESDVEHFGSVCEPTYFAGIFVQVRGLSRYAP